MVPLGTVLSVASLCESVPSGRAPFGIVLLALGVSVVIGHRTMSEGKL